MLVMVRFKESYSIFQITLVFLKSRKNCNLSKKIFPACFWGYYKKVVKNVPSDKAWAGEISIKILIESKFCFPELSDITSAFKKLDPSDKANYRPVSILSLVSKVFEKIMYDQLYKCLENFLIQLVCGFRQAHSAQHTLLRL